MTTILNRSWEKVQGLYDVIYHKTIWVNGIPNDKIIITHTPRSKSTTYCHITKDMSITINGKTFEELTPQFETEVLILLLGGSNGQADR